MGCERNISTMVLGSPRVGRKVDLSRIFLRNAISMFASSLSPPLELGYALARVAVGGRLCVATSRLLMVDCVLPRRHCSTDTMNHQLTCNIFAMRWRVFARAFLTLCETVVGCGIQYMGRPVFMRTWNPWSATISNGQQLSVTHRTISALLEC